MCIVGVTTTRYVDDQVHRDWIRRQYVDALYSFSNVEVVLLPTWEADWRPTSRLLNSLDGLVLTGDESDVDFRGAILDCAFKDSYVNGVRDHYRDRLSFRLLEAALKTPIPILGICRGLQELNLFLGGSLHQDLSDRACGVSHVEDLSLPRDRQYDPVHNVLLAENSVVAGILKRYTIRVNSLHRQGIDTVGDMLEVEGTSDDGLVEAIRVKGAPFQIGVQWHPEWHARRDENGRLIFHAFGAACRNYGSSRI